MAGHELRVFKQQGGDLGVADEYKKGTDFQQRPRPPRRDWTFLEYVQEADLDAQIPA